MSRLYRPHIPLSVRCEVSERQLSKWFINVPFHKVLSKRLALLLDLLAAKIGCTVKDLRLDHDPPLAARPRRRKGLGRKTYYIPDANDPDHLFYRPHGPEFEGSHLIKTNVRGDHGQFPDRVLIKRERRRQKKAAGKRPVRKMHTKIGQRRRGKAAKAPAKHNRKYNWPSRPLRGKPWRGSKTEGGRDAGAHGNSDR